MSGVSELETHLREKAAELKALSRDWDSYDALPPNQETVDKAVEVALALFPLFPTNPSLVPLSDGSVQLEWTAGSWDVEIHIRKVS